MLTHVVSLDYRQDALAVLLGIRKITLTPSEKSRKSVADDVDIQKASMIISVLDDYVSTECF